MKSTRRGVAWATGVVLALGTVAGCSGGGSGDAGSSGGSASMAQDQAEPAPATEGGGGSAKAAGANRAPVQQQLLIKTGEVYLTSKHPDDVRDEAERLAKAVGGTVEADQTYNDARGHTEESTMTLRVPVASFEATYKAIKRLGRLKHADDGSKDVTTQVIDVEERAQTLQNSIDRMQKFQRQATDVTDLLRYENEITDRQAELQSLTAQRDYLRDQTSMSTITLHLSTPTRYVPPPDALKDAGFWTGLRSGLHALGDTVVVALTIIGALIPFALAGLVVGVPVWWLVRLLLRRRPRKQSPPPTPAAG
jgi:hypothetical protein